MSGAFRDLGGTRVLQYHNITPAHFFADYHPEVFRIAALGRADLKSLSASADLALGDSDYNRRELETLGLSLDGRLPHRAEPGPHHEGAAAPGALEDPGRRADELPVRGPHGPEQADRGHHPPG